MLTNKPFCINFSGITIRFVLPAPAELSNELVDLICKEKGDPDVEYEIHLLRHPLCPTSEPYHNAQGTYIYQTDEVWLRIYPLRRAEDGCQVACLLRPNGKNILYYPEVLWHHYASPLHCCHLIAIESLLLQHNAFLLHSSVVALNGKTVLFSGPSGAGKSTQAELWAKYLGADILNGDRCVIMKKGGGFYGGGSPLAGHSCIYRKEQAPIAGIFLVNKSDKNRIQRLGGSAFAPLFSQVLINSWDHPFMESITSLFQEMLSQVPVYQLDCRADEESVYTAYHTLF